MKKCIFLFFLFGYSLVNAEEKKNSLSKTILNKKSIFGITVAPNYSWRKYYNEMQFSYGKPENEKPDFGCSVLVNEKTTLKHFMFNMGVGLSIYNYQGHSTGDSQSPPIINITQTGPTNM